MGEPSEHPILFTGEMVRAILAGTKTQTRRVARPQPSFAYSGTARVVYGPHPFSPSAFVGTPAEGRVDGTDRDGWLAEDWCGNVVGASEADALRCPYGVPGDTLWARETWAAVPAHDDTKPSEIDRCREPLWYRATDESNMRGRWRPSIHMPRWASRLSLRVTDVRVERVQDISEEDARAEGCSTMTQLAPFPALNSYVAGFQRLWDTINAKRGYSWASNPWVWVVSFAPAGEVRRG